jgi:hypothetical protein
MASGFCGDIFRISIVSIDHKALVMTRTSVLAYSGNFLKHPKPFSGQVHSRRNGISSIYAVVSLMSSYSRVVSLSRCAPEFIVSSFEWLAPGPREVD